MAGIEERYKKSSVTQLVHSTIGLGLLKPQAEADIAKTPTFLVSPEENSCVGLGYYSKRSAGSASSEKMAVALDMDRDGGITSLDTGTRAARLPHQQSQDG